MARIEVSISTGADDGHWNNAASFSNSASNVLMLDTASEDWRSYYRFQNIAIPQGSIITSSHIRFVSYANYSSGGIQLWANDIDDAINPTDADTGDALVKTNSSTIDLTAWTTNSVYTVDVTNPVQEVINRSGWSSGNDMMIIGYAWSTYYTHGRSAYSYDEGSGKEAILVIDYVSPGIINEQTTSNAGSPMKSNGFEQLGQAFTAKQEFTVSSVNFKLTRSGTITGNVYAYIYNVTGTPAPQGVGAVPTGSALATSDAVVGSTITTSFSPAATTFTFSGANQITLEAGKSYAVVFEYDGLSTGDISFWSNNTADLLNNQNIVTYDGSVWDDELQFGSDDAYFVLYGTIKGTTKSLATGAQNETSIGANSWSSTSNIVANDDAYVSSFVGSTISPP